MTKIGEQERKQHKRCRKRPRNRSGQVNARVTKCNTQPDREQLGIELLSIWEHFKIGKVADPHIPMFEEEDDGRKSFLSRLC